MRSAHGPRRWSRGRVRVDGQFEIRRCRRAAGATSPAVRPHRHPPASSARTRRAGWPATPRRLRSPLARRRPSSATSRTTRSWLPVLSRLKLCGAWNCVVRQPVLRTEQPIHLLDGGELDTRGVPRPVARGGHQQHGPRRRHRRELHVRMSPAAGPRRSRSCRRPACSATPSSPAPTPSRDRRPPSAGTSAFRRRRRRRRRCGSRRRPAATRGSRARGCCSRAAGRER